MACIGDIAIVGHVLAYGYLNDSSLTEKHFVEPLNLAAGLTVSRIYLFGDIVRCTADGKYLTYGTQRLNGQGEQNPSRAWRVGATTSAIGRCFHFFRSSVVAR